MILWCALSILSYFTLTSTDSLHCDKPFSTPLKNTWIACRYFQGIFVIRCLQLLQWLNSQLCNLGGTMLSLDIALLQPIEKWKKNFLLCYSFLKKTHYILLTNWLLLYELSLIRKCLKTVIFGSHFAIENIFLSIYCPLYSLSSS